jgi:hypothetical protein
MQKAKRQRERDRRVSYKEIEEETRQRRRDRIRNSREVKEERYRFREIEVEREKKMDYVFKTAYAKLFLKKVYLFYENIE